MASPAWCSSRSRRRTSRYGTFWARVPACRYTRCSARIAIDCRCTRCAAGITTTIATWRITAGPWKRRCSRDIGRIKLALDIVGKGKRVMVDSNQVFNRNLAMRRGRVYEQMGCFWFEEPLPPHDIEGFAELAQE